MSIPIFTLKTSNTSNSNFIVILDCLNPVSDISSPRRNHDDLRVKLVGKDNPEKIEQNLKLITCANKQEFLHFFEALFQHFNNPGFKPMFIIHAHGDKKNGLQLPDNSFIEWSKLIELFYGVTKRCNGDLTVISGFCHSYELIKHIPKNERLPFAFYYGYDNKISAGTVEDEINKIIQSFINDGGKHLFSILPKLRIKCYGEFDFIRVILIHALLMAADPKMLSALDPNLSQNKIKKSIYNKIEGPLQGIDKLIKQITRTDILAVELIKHYMYDTERRTYALKSVDNYFSLLNTKR
ncbi:hypothetical protein ACSBQS_05410 [Serratia sp. H402Y]|uniref:hypothetical protein n=1 Tax=Serratia TaxID=613 RepID=UPI001F43A7CE|nr:hypothetical protein [Serratia ureilytica]